MNDLSTEWEEFSNITIDDNDEIEQPFLDFPVGTDRMEIWHWFDENHSNGVAHLMGL